MAPCDFLFGDASTGDAIMTSFIAHVPVEDISVFLNTRHTFFRVRIGLTLDLSKFTRASVK